MKPHPWILFIYLLLECSVVGVERDVVSCDLRSIVAWLTSPHGAQPPVNFQPIPNATACTVFAVRHQFLAVATTENVILYEFDSRLRSFSILTVSAVYYFHSLLMISSSLIMTYF